MLSEKNHSEKNSPHGFPKGFLWGSATASYQVEGGISNTDWARAALKGRVPECGKATDHYNRFESDFDIAQSLGHNAHRFSIEWARIEPEEGKFDDVEIEHYRKVIRALKARGMEPFVTLWHFTLPIWFEEKGGFLHSDAPKLFARYCAFVTERLGGEAHFWMTINEPLVWASGGYRTGKWPPFVQSPLQFLRVFGKLAHAHKEAYTLMKTVAPNIDIGIAKHNVYFSSDSKPWNIFLAKLGTWFWNKRFLNMIRRHQDFIGLNYYFYKKFGGHESLPKSDMGWDLFPEGLYRCLQELAVYKKPIYVTENGLADRNDTQRAWFIEESVNNVARALRGGVPVKGYLYWSLLDNYEWSFGFDERFGLVEINYETLERTIRPSALIYKGIIEKNTL